MSVGTMVAIVAAVVVGYGGLVALILGQGSGLRGEMGGLRGEMGGLRTELKADIADLKTELKADIADLKTELKADNADLKTELKADNDKLDAKVESLRTEVKGISCQVADMSGELRQLDERVGHLDRLTERLVPIPHSN
ncbi:MAG: hypothetical protein ACYDAG_10935 [Chloroflexota bacterium]